VDNHEKTKKEKAREIEDKLKETYDAYCGSKAADFERKIKFAI